MEHADSEAEAEVVVEVPSGHDVQLVEPAFEEYVPAAHGSHVSAKDAAELPALQLIAAYCTVVVESSSPAKRPNTA